MVLLLLVQLRDGQGHGRHGGLVHQEEKCLVGVKLESSSDNFDQFTHSDMVRNEKFGLVQYGELLFRVEPLDDARDFTGVLLPDLFHILHSQSEAPPFFEWFLHVDDWLVSFYSIYNEYIYLSISVM